MGRPPKSADTPEARERIIAAFWKLLSDHELRDISVSKVSAEAHCSRGSFYYHFADIDDLMYHAIERDTEATAFVGYILRIASGTGAPPKLGDWYQHIDHLLLIMEHGGARVILEKAIAVVTNLWRTALYPNGGDLSPESKLIIRYNVSGTFEIFRSVIDQHPSVDPERIFETSFFRSASKLTLEQISKLEHVTINDIATRLHEGGEQ